MADCDINLVFLDIDYSPATAPGANAALRGNRPAYVINGRGYGPDAGIEFREQLLDADHLPKGLRYAVHFVFNRQQQVLTASEPDLPFEQLETATVSHSSHP